MCGRFQSAALGVVMCSIGLMGCEVSMEPHMMEKSLRPAISKPDVLAKICGVSVREIKTVVDDNLKVSDVKAHRKVYPSPGSGTASVAYDQQGLPSCRATVRFDFEQEDGMGQPSITNISVL